MSDTPNTHEHNSHTHHESAKRKRTLSLSTKSSQKSLSRSSSSIPSTPTSFTTPNEITVPTAETSTLRLTTNLPATALDPTTTRADSPCTKVAWNFQGLHLGRDDDMAACITPRTPHRNSTSQSSSSRHNSSSDVQEVKRRMRALEGREREIPETPRAFAISIGPERNVDPALQARAGLVTLHNRVDPVVFESAERTLAAARKRDGVKGIKGVYSSDTRLDQPRSRKEDGRREKERETETEKVKMKKRRPVSELSLFGAGDATKMGGENAKHVHEEVDMRPVDRKALTWHNDEITGHDPNDPDDDGEGINGIGFKPTPAIAYHRAEARKKQMAEYKAREAREARARRGERRRGDRVRGVGERVKKGVGIGDKSAENRMSRDEEETERRVRFLSGTSNGSGKSGRETISIGLAI